MAFSEFSVWSNIILISSSLMLDLKNVGIAVGISLISCPIAEIRVFEVWRPPSWICPLPVLSRSFPISPSGMLGLRSVGFGVGLPVTSC